MKPRFSAVLLIGIFLLWASGLVYGLSPSRFGWFLALFVPGVLLVTFYVLSHGTRLKVRRTLPLQAFLLLVLVDGLFITVYGLYSYTHPSSNAAGWAALVVACLGFLVYISTLALWHWKRWGLALFQGASIALAAFVLLGGGSPVLAVFIFLGVIVLSLMLRSVRKQMV